MMKEEEIIRGIEMRRRRKNIEKEVTLDLSGLDFPSLSFLNVIHINLFFFDENSLIKC